MLRKAPISIGIQPQIALFTVVLGATCAFAAYSEKYRRDEDDIDEKLKGRFYSEMKDQHSKIPQMAQTIRGQDVRLDDAMNKWVWGGKANLTRAQDPQPTPTSTPLKPKSKKQHQPSSQEDSSVALSDDELEQYDDDDDDNGGITKSTLSSSSTEERAAQKVRRRKKRDRGKRRDEKKFNILEAEADKKRQEEAKKLMIQSVAVGATVGAVAVAATVFLSSTTRRP